MASKIKKLTNDDKNNLLSKTFYVLPDNPSNKNFSPSQIKRKGYEGYLVLFDYINSLIDAINNNYDSDDFDYATKADITYVDELANTKLDKTTSSGGSERVYGVDVGGGQTIFNTDRDYTIYAFENNLVKRFAGGQIALPLLPERDENAISKYYADLTYATKDYVATSIATVYKYKGSVATYDNLPTNNLNVGDVYNVEDTGDNYAWDGTKWDKLSGLADLKANNITFNNDNTNLISTNVQDVIKELNSQKIEKQTPGVFSAYVVYSDGTQTTYPLSNGGTSANVIPYKDGKGVLYGQTYDGSNNSYVNIKYLKENTNVKNKTFTNPVLINSSTSDYFPDPTVWQGDDGYFYAFSTTYDKHVFRSVDLVNWEDCGYSILDETSEATIWNWGYNKIWAPSVHKIGTKWNLYMGAVRDNTDTRKSGIVVMTSDKPYGPFKNPIMLVEGTYNQDNIDPFVYSEYNELYLVYGGSYGIWKTRLNDDGTKIIGNYNRIAGLTINNDPDREKVFEGAYIYRRGIYQYLFVSSGKTHENNYKLRVGRATLQSNGAWSEYVDRQGNRMLDGYAETILTDPIRSPGHNGNIFLDSLGKTYMFYHARLKGVSSGWKRAMYLQELKWDDEGWCYFENSSIADTEIYPFNVRYQDNSIGCNYALKSDVLDLTNGTTSFSAIKVGNTTITETQLQQLLALLELTN